MIHIIIGSSTTEKTPQTHYLNITENSINLTFDGYDSFENTFFKGLTTESNLIIRQNDFDFCLHTDYNDDIHATIVDRQLGNITILENPEEVIENISFLGFDEYNINKIEKVLYELGI